MPLDRNFEPVRYQRHISEFDFHGSMSRFASDKSFDSGVQFQEMEWLCQIIIRTQFDPLHLVLDRVFGRDDDQVLCFSSLFQFLQKGKPIAVGQHNVQQDTVVVVHQRLVQAFVHRCSCLYDAPFPEEKLLDGFPQIRFIFDNEDFHLDSPVWIDLLLQI